MRVQREGIGITKILNENSSLEEIAMFDIPFVSPGNCPSCGQALDPMRGHECPTSSAESTPQTDEGDGFADFYESDETRFF